jgi:hypothetical protein
MYPVFPKRRRFYYARGAALKSSLARRAVRVFFGALAVLNLGFTGGSTRTVRMPMSRAVLERARLAFETKSRNRSKVVPK